MTDELEAIVLTAGSAYSEGRYHEALECYEQAIALRPENAILFANYAAILLRLDRVDEALKNADHAIKLDPKWAKAYYRKGEALRRLHALLPAVVSLSEGVALDPSNNLIAELLVDVSQQLFKHFPLERLRGVGLDRDRFIVLTMIGQELAAAGHHREALTVLGRALSLRTSSLRLRESALSSLASVHFMLGEYAQATIRYEEQLQISLQLDGPPAEVHDNVAMSAEAAGDYTLALSHRKRKAKFLTKMALAEERLKIARLHGRLNQVEEALELYKKVEDSFESMSEDERQRIANQIHIGRGIAHSIMGDTTKCLQELSGVRASSEDDAVEIVDSVVTCYLREGNMEEAVEYLNEVLSKASELKQEKLFGHVCFLLAREQIRNGHHASAIRLAKRILRLARSTDDRALKRSGLQLLATIYEEQQDAKSSVTLLKKLLEVPGATVLDSVNTLLHLATLAPEVGDDPRKYLGEALEQSRMSRNLDVVALAQSAMLRYLDSSAVEDKDCRMDELLSLQRELLRERISVTSRSIIYEDLAMCDSEASSSSGELRALEQSLSEAQEGNNTRRQLFLLEKLGDSCLFTERYAEAQGFYQQMLTLARQLREVAQIKRAFMKLAILAGESMHCSKCVEFSKNALTLSRLCRDLPSKAYMLLLTARAELQRGNVNVALSILEKTIRDCERHDLRTTKAIASRLMVDVSLANGQNEKQVLEHLRRHICLFASEPNPKAKLLSILRFVKTNHDLDSFTALGVVAAVKKAASSLQDCDRVMILLECVDAYHGFSLRDETWRLLEELLDSPVPEIYFQKVAEHLERFSLQRRALPLLRLVEQGFSDPRYLTQLAVFTPSLVLSKLSDEEILPGIVCHMKLRNWGAALASTVKAMADEATSQSPMLDGVFGDLTTQEALLHAYLVSRWKVDGSIHCPTLSALNDAGFCSFFDLSSAELLSQRVALISRSRAHLHALMSLGHYDLMHEAARPVEKIICAAFLGETEMMEMWYDELVEEYLGKQSAGLELFPLSTLEFQLKVATVFMALQHESFEEQLRLMETSKWLMDKKIKESHGGCVQQFQFMFPFHQKSFTYIYKVGKVALTLLWDDNGDSEDLSFTVDDQDVDLMFFEESLVKYLEQRRIPQSLEISDKMTELVFVNDDVPIPTNPKVYSLSECSNFMEQNGQSGNLYSQLKRLSSTLITVVDAADGLLHPDICLSLGVTPLIVISRGPLPFESVRSLFVCGTDTIVMLDLHTSEREIEHLIAEICMTDDAAAIMSLYNSFVRSQRCLQWSLPVLTAMEASLNPDGTQGDEVIAGKDDMNQQTDKRTEKSQENPHFMLETRHINNFWQNTTRLRMCDGHTDIALARTIDSLLKILSRDRAFAVRPEQHNACSESDFNRKKRRKNKTQNFVTRDYQSDCGEGGKHEPMHSRSCSDLNARPSSSTASVTD